MGIRFDCPNGHHLHVKAFLAGRRGICPDCGAKLLIPTESRPPQEGANSFASSVTNESIEIAIAHTRATTNPRRRRQPTRRIHASKPVPPPSGPDLAASTPSITSVSAMHEESANPLPEQVSPPEVWFVRPPAGGQYGPASDATFARWIREGRIVRDAYVWREGWSSWHLVSSVTDRLPGDVSEAVLLSMTSNDANREQTAVTKASAAAAEIRRARRRSSRRHWLLAIVLLILVIALSGLLILVLRSGT